MMPKQVGKLDKATLIVLILLSIPVAWFAFTLAPIMAADPNLVQLLDGLNVAIAEPLHIRCVDASPKYVLLLVGLYGVS